jgi:predicted alpha/beta superfamily hydrolase
MNVVMTGFIFIAISFIGLAKAEDIVVGKYETISSIVLNETRQIMVSLPKDYDADTYSYPVLYFTDATQQFQTMTSTAHFLAENDVIPPMIIVGIVTTANRTRDLTPSISKEALAKPSWYSNQNPGGAGIFAGFLESELMPYINKHYRTADFNVFSGHSLGGLFSIHTYLTKPELFDGYMAVSPSLWWDNERLVTDAKLLVEEKILPNKRLFISKGSEEGPMDSTYKALNSLFEANNKENVTFQAFPEENHLTVVFQANYHGLKAIFSEWSLPFAEGAKGIDVVKAHNEKVKAIYKINFTSEGWMVNLGNSELYNKKRYDKAIEALEYYTQLFPKSAYSYFLLAKALEAKDEFKSAFQYYQKANTLVPQSHSTKKIYQDNLERAKGLL